MVTKQEIYSQIEHLSNKPDSSFTELVERYDCAELCNRKNFDGHITASGTIVHIESREVLLLHHKFLDKWHVPGGHVDATDESTLAAALREVVEETGIEPAHLQPLNTLNGETYCLEINSHPIPRNEKKQEEAHFHHDFRYLFGYSGERDIAIDDSESLDYKWVGLDDEYLATIIDVDKIVELIDEAQLDYDELEVEKSVNAYSSAAIIEDFARFGVVKQRDYSKVDQRGDRRVFNKSEGGFFWFYSETDNFSPNDIDWQEQMTIVIRGSEHYIKHICTPRISSSTVSIEEFVDISELPIGEYNFELRCDCHELCEFDFYIVDVASSYREYAKYHNAQLQGVGKDGVVKTGEMCPKCKSPLFDAQAVDRLRLSFSFSDIFNIERLECTVAIYYDCNRYIQASESDGRYAEFEDTEMFDVTDNGKKLQMAGIFDYDKELVGFSLSRGYYTLVIKMFEEVIERVNFTVR